MLCYFQGVQTFIDIPFQIRNNARVVFLPTKFYQHQLDWISNGVSLGISRIISWETLIQIQYSKSLPQLGCFEDFRGFWITICLEHGIWWNMEGCATGARTPRVWGAQSGWAWLTGFCSIIAWEWEPSSWLSMIDVLGLVALKPAWLHAQSS